MFHRGGAREHGGRGAVLAGAIAINLSALAGFRTAGLGGAVLSCIAAILPPLAILGLVSAFYAAFAANAVIAAVLKGMQAGVAALIVDLIIDMCRMLLKERSPLLTAMIPCAFLASFVLNVNVALTLAAELPALQWDGVLLKMEGSAR